MILLPDITISVDGIVHTLSLQDPYTLNGKLITRIELIDSEPTDYYTYEYFGTTTTTTIRMPRCESIHIGDEDGYFISVTKDYLKDIVHDKLRRFFYEQRSNEVRVGEYNYKWTIRQNYDIESYLRDLVSQCERISDSNPYFSLYSDRDFISNCKERLRNQGRLQEENTESQSNSWTYLNNAFRAFGTSIRDYSGVLAWSPSTSSESSEQQKKYIHDYNYKPTYIKHYMQDEDKSSLLLGAEIEVAGNDKILDKQEVVKKCIQIMNGSDDDTEDLIYSTSDSTVQIELDTMPCTLNYHKQRMNYKELFKYLDELGYKGHDCENAGLHIHADRSYLGSTELKQQLVITKILYILEKFNDEICVIARRNHEYSKFVGKEEAKETLHKLYSKYNDSGKKVALNLKHKDTIEFRCFRSTLKYETFILTLEFVKDIIDYAKSVNIEEIELIQWSDLMDTFSDELKEYYNDRLEKEKQKKIKDLEEGKKSNVSLGNGTLYFHDGTGSFAVGSSELSGLTATVSTIDESFDESSYITTATTSPYHDRMYHRWLGDVNDCTCASTPSGTATFTLDSSVDVNTFFDAISGSYSLGVDQYGNQSISRINTSSEEIIENLEDPIGNKRKEISSLKKRINNCVNYMEKVHLQQELSQAQKDLKRMKKQINNSNNDSNNTNNSSNETICTATIQTNTVNANRTLYVDDCCSNMRWAF